MISLSNNFATLILKNKQKDEVGILNCDNKLQIGNTKHEFIDDFELNHDVFNLSATVSESFAFSTQVSWMRLSIVTVRWITFQWRQRMGQDVNVTCLTFLGVILPRVSTHPTASTFRTSEFSKHTFAIQFVLLLLIKKMSNNLKVFKKRQKKINKNRTNNWCLVTNTILKRDLVFSSDILFCLEM